MADVFLQGIGLINFEVYRSGTSRLMGLANIELTTAEPETVDMKGNGIAGTVAMPIRSNLGSMELKLTWRTPPVDAAKLFRYERIDLSLYGAVENVDAGNGGLKPHQHRLEVSGFPKNWNLGKWEPSSTIDSELTLEVAILNYFYEGVEKLAFDKLNYVYRIDGEDFASPYRKAVGLI